MSFYYYGAKHRLAPTYPLPRHRIIIEPFAGAAGYATYHLVNDNADRAFLIEKDPRVADLWRRLLGMTDVELEELEPPAPGDVTDDFLFISATASSGAASCWNFTMNERTARETPRLVRRLQRNIPHLRGKVVVIEGDYTCAPRPGVGATYFVDPPYQDIENNGSRGNRYATGCKASDLNYSELAKWVKALPGFAIVAEQAGANWLPFRHHQRNRASIGKQGVEMIYTSAA